MTGYIGRFAPSPTGPLHLGSLMTALASYLDAKANSGLWLVRVEDIDPPREQEGATRAILESLLAHGLSWDGPVLYQSKRLDCYRKVIHRLLKEDHAYACICSRLQLKKHIIYNGECRNKRIPLCTKAAIRIKCPNEIISFDDAIQGLQSHQMDTDIGDFVIQRKDGYVAYQLAVALDDNFQHISHVVRGSDLLESTSRQIMILRHLGLKAPRYSHIPVIVNQQGQKLSKQTFARALDPDKSGENLIYALMLLGQEPAPKLANMSSRRIIQWAVSNWSIDKVPRNSSVYENMPY